jgi:integrase
LNFISSVNNETLGFPARVISDLQDWNFVGSVNTQLRLLTLLHGFLLDDKTLLRSREAEEHRSQQQSRCRVATLGRVSDELFKELTANKLREKQLHPLLVKLGIPRGGFHSMRHGAASALLADGATPAVVQRQLRHSDARITLGLYGHVVGDQQRNAVENRSTRIAEYGVN